MAKAIYMGIDSKARKIKKAYVGIDGKARKIKKIYIGVDGKARLVWSSGGSIEINYPFKGMLSFVGTNSTEAQRDLTKLELTTGLTGSYVINRSQSTSGYNMNSISKNGKTVLVRNNVYHWNESTQAYETIMGDAFSPSSSSALYSPVKWLDYTNGSGFYGHPAITRDGSYVILIYTCKSEYENYVGKGFSVYSCTGSGATTNLIGRVDLSNRHARPDYPDYTNTTSQSYFKAACSDDISTIATCYMFNPSEASDSCIAFYIHQVTNQDVANAVELYSDWYYDESAYNTICEVSADGKYVFWCYYCSSSYTKQMRIFSISDGAATLIYSLDNHEACTSVGPGEHKLIDYGDGYFDIVRGTSTKGIVFSFHINGSNVTYLGKYTLSSYYILADLSLDKKYGARIYYKNGSRSIGYCSVSRSNTNLPTGISDIYSTSSYTYVSYNPNWTTLLS